MGGLFHELGLSLIGQISDLDAVIVNAGLQVIGSGLTVDGLLLFAVGLCSLAQDGLSVSIIGVPDLLGHVEQEGAVNVVGHGDVLLDFLELIAIKVCNGVLFAVNSALLQSGVQLGGRHRGGSSAQAVPQLLMELVFHGTDLQAGNVGNRSNSVLAVGQLTETVFVPCKIDDALFSQLGVQVVTNYGSQNLVGLGFVIEQEGDVENPQLGHIAHQRSGGGVVDLQLTGNDHLGSGGIVAQLSAGVNLNTDVALGVVLNHGGEHGQLSLHAGRGLAGTVGNLHNDGVGFALRLGRGAVRANLGAFTGGGGGAGGGAAGAASGGLGCGQAATGQRCSHGQGQQQCKNILFHGVSS
ncbi:hypothetical protein SDC9_76796 [bioreactor metagenome]|uniref:NAD-specific glutamate dehydrogenase n=1 Tax=bioreactor metagenome TaxID=1076179 RepID=A0A644YQH1_9ZZZZ